MKTKKIVSFLLATALVLSLCVNSVAALSPEEISVDAPYLNEVDLVPFEERIWTLDDLNYDSDNDGILDSVLIEEAVDIPLPRTTRKIVEDTTDSDGDGLTDTLEQMLGTNPHDADSDGDGVNDYIEFYVVGTDPLQNDSDTDTDGDGLSNLEEVLLGTNPSECDTDADGLTDADEVGIYFTDPCNSDTDGDGLLDGAEIELGLNPLVAKSDGITLDSQTAEGQLYLDELAAQVYVAESTYTPAQGGISLFAAVDDADYDGVTGTKDYNTSSNAFSGTLKTDYGDDAPSSSVSYVMDYRWFFNSATTYRKDLAVVSSLAAAQIYEKNKLTVTSGGSLSSSYVVTSLQDWMNFHGMTNVAIYKIASTDNHVSEMYVGSRQVTYNGSTRTIVCAVVRGTNGTLKEWSSNFDLGTTAKYSSYSDWTTVDNHMGFDIAATRLNNSLNNYVSRYCSGTIVYWLTGHSRGAGIANILAARLVNAGKTVYAYTFASPNTTTSSSATNSKYNCIFNIVNTDDFVAAVPMTQWSFKRYGITKSASIGSVSNDKAAWNRLTGLSYNRDSILSTTVSSLAGIASNRNDCYVIQDNSNNTINVTGLYYSETARNNALTQLIGTYTSNMSGTYQTYTTKEYDYYNGVYSYGYRVAQAPSFFLQAAAAVSCKVMGDNAFLVLDVAPRYHGAKAALIRSSVFAGIRHPHYNESYYFLATKLT